MDDCSRTIGSVFARALAERNSPSVDLRRETSIGIELSSPLPLLLLLSASSVIYTNIQMVCDGFCVCKSRLLYK
jgi:hypothetical protein